MAPLSHSELHRIETKFSEGITSAQVVKIFQAKGERFSEATLRKYVQLGLLPTSRRVGMRGRHRGSSGLYPGIIVRLANEIKRGLAAGKSLEEIRTGPLSLAGDIEVVRRASELTLAKISRALERQPAAVGRQLKKTLVEHKKSFNQFLRGLEGLVARLGKSGA